MNIRSKWPVGADYYTIFISENIIIFYWKHQNRFLIVKMNIHLMNLCSVTNTFKQCTGTIKIIHIRNVTQVAKF